MTPKTPDEMDARSPLVTSIVSVIPPFEATPVPVRRDSPILIRAPLCKLVPVSVSVKGSVHPLTGLSAIIVGEVADTGPVEEIEEGEALTVVTGLFSTATLQLEEINKIEVIANIDLNFMNIFRPFSINLSFV